MNKPRENLNSGPCSQCDTKETVELTLPAVAERSDDIVRWCVNGHVTCYHSGRGEWTTVFNFTDME